MLGIPCRIHNLGRKRPDLRRDCDLVQIESLSSGLPGDGKDLIYEGIATNNIHRRLRRHYFDGKDLIYEGIATFQQQS